MSDLFFFFLRYRHGGSGRAGCKKALTLKHTHGFPSALPVTLTHPLDLAQVIQAVRPAAEYVLTHSQLALQVAAAFVVFGQQPLGLQLLLLPDSQVAIPARYLQHP